MESWIWGSAMHGHGADNLAKVGIRMDKFARACLPAPTFWTAWGPDMGASLQQNGFDWHPDGQRQLPHLSNAALLVFGSPCMEP